MRLRQQLHDRLLPHWRPPAEGNRMPPEPPAVPAPHKVTQPVPRRAGARHAALGQASWALMLRALGQRRPGVGRVRRGLTSMGGAVR